MALFVTFEGIEGSGKTTQMRRLARHARRLGIPCTVTREPGGEAIGEKIRRILLNPVHGKVDPLCELFLYEAARAQHVREVIEPLLKKKVLILCDRYSDASVAYQGYGRGLDLGLIYRLNRIATRGIMPDLTLLFDCPAKEGVRRAIRRNRRLGRKEEDRLERERIQFHRRVRMGYLSIARDDPQRVKVIDARQSEKEVFETVCRLVGDRLEDLKRALSRKRDIANQDRL